MSNIEQGTVNSKVKKAEAGVTAVITPKYGFAVAVLR
jgi:hypothetical protein